MTQPCLYVNFNRSIEAAGDESKVCVDSINKISKISITCVENKGQWIDKTFPLIVYLIPNGYKVNAARITNRKIVTIQLKSIKRIGTADNIILIYINRYNHKSLLNYIFFPSYPILKYMTYLKILEIC